jgi:hypothetical protein
MIEEALLYIAQVTGNTPAIVQDDFIKKVEAGEIEVCEEHLYMGPDTRKPISAEALSGPERLFWWRWVRRADVERLWPPPPVGQDEKLTRAREWLISKAQQDGRRLKQANYQEECMKRFGLPWREYLEVMRSLPAEYRCGRGHH